jgi:hypothetical protein
MGNANRNRKAKRSERSDSGSTNCCVAASTSGAAGGYVIVLGIVRHSAMSCNVAGRNDQFYRIP